MPNLKIDLSEDTNGARDEQGVLNTIDFSDWYFDFASDELRTALTNILRKEIAEAFRNTVQSDPPDIEFVSDGASIYVSINIGSNWNDGRIWFTASIEEMIDEYIERTHRDEMDGGDDAKLALAKCLRACAVKLEKAAKESL